MGGSNKVAEKALESHWVLDIGPVLAAPGSDSVRPGLDLEFRRRIPFHPHSFQLGPLAANNHWNLDLGVGSQVLGWTGGRPGAATAFLRAGIGYNLLNLISLGASVRGGYANVSDGDKSSGGLLWSAGLRFAGIVDRIAVFSEVGVLSLPSPTGEGHDRGAYGLAGFGYVF
jgi:hypothetical protein